MFSEDGSVLVQQDSIVVVSRYNVAQMTFSGEVHIKKENKNHQTILSYLFYLISIVYIHELQNLRRLHLLSI